MTNPNIEPQLLSPPPEVPNSPESLAPPRIEKFEDAVALAAEDIRQFSFLNVRGVSVAGGKVTSNSLMGGLEKLVAETEDEKSDPNIKSFFTVLANLSAETTGGYEMENPMISYLISRGSYEKTRPTVPSSEPNPTGYSSSDRRQPQDPHVRADGHAIRGKIVPGVGIMTSQGIVRTRGTPRR